MAVFFYCHRHGRWLQWTPQAAPTLDPGGARGPFSLLRGHRLAGGHNQ